MLFTIGHSTHTIETFIKFLVQNEVEAIADVRSSPYSRFQSQYNREALSIALQDVGIEYVFLGENLGGRSQDSDDYENNRVVYSRMKQKKSFEVGLDRLETGSQKFKLAIMCSEKDPIDCHRTLLVSKALVERGLSIKHILDSGQIESHEASMNRLLKIYNMDKPDLFRSEDEILEEVLLRQESKVAFVLGDSALGRIGISRFGSDDSGFEVS